MNPVYALVTGLVTAFGGPVTGPVTTSAPAVTHPAGSFAGPVTGLSVEPAGATTSVLIAVDGPVEYRDFTMEGPHRLVLDIMDSRHELPRDEYTGLNRGGIQSIRTSQYAEDIVRVVLVLNDKVTYAVERDPRGLRIRMANPSGAFEPWTSGSDAGGGVTAAPPVRAAAPDVRNDPAQRASPTGDGTTFSSTRVARPRQESQARRISIQFTNTPIQDVLLSFAAFSGRSIIPGSGVTGLVTADIRNQPWDVALRAILSRHGLVAEEDDYGIIVVDNIGDLNDREAVEPIETIAYRINYATASELQQAISPLLSERGSVTSGQGTNTLIVSDIGRVQGAVSTLLRDLDVRTPQVNIKAKIIFVNRTDLNELGITYEVKDSRGNQFNELSDGGFDQNGDGFIDPDTESIEQGEAGVLLGGNSIAALGNANARVANPTLQLLTSLVIGRHQLISFIDALSSVNLSDIQAEPQTTVLDNQQARLKVGADVPVRTIDAGAGGGAGGFPTAQVAVEETGIILQATPHVTNNGTILLELSVERSSADLAESDVGFIKQTQEATTRVLVEDGETVVIAGLSQSERTEVRSGIPLLMDLPLIGRLFRQTREQEIQRDLIILVTPHIVRGLN